MPANIFSGSAIVKLFVFPLVCGCISVETLYDSYDKPYYDTRLAIERFSQENGCDGPARTDALVGIAELERLVGLYESGNARDTLALHRQRHQEVAFDFANAATAKGCTADARKVYGDLIAFYDEDAMSAVRERAQVKLTLLNGPA